MTHLWGKQATFTFLRVFENLKLAVKQCYQIGQLQQDKKSKFKFDILTNFQTILSCFKLRNCICEKNEEQSTLNISRKRSHIYRQRQKEKTHLRYYSYHIPLIGINMKHSALPGIIAFDDIEWEQRRIYRGKIVNVNYCFLPRIAMAVRMIPITMLKTDPLYIP